MVVAPVGLILGTIALRRIRSSGAKGRGLAITGIVLGTLWIVSVSALLAYAATGAFDASPSNITEEREILPGEVEPGHCANLADVDEAGERVLVVPCSDPHDVEIIADLGEDVSASTDGMSAISLECTQRVNEIVGDIGPIYMGVFPLDPTDADDPRGTKYLCAALSSGATMTGSFVVGDAVLS